MDAVKELERQVNARRKHNPTDSVATFAEVSFEAELDEGIEPAIAATRWLDWLGGRK